MANKLTKEKIDLLIEQVLNEVSINVKNDEDLQKLPSSQIFIMT